MSTNTVYNLCTWRWSRFQATWCTPCGQNFWPSLKFVCRFQPSRRR